MDSATVFQELEMANKTLRLTDAGHKLGLSYNATLRLVLTGELQGGRDKAGRWVAEATAVEAMARARQRVATAP